MRFRQWFEAVQQDIRFYARDRAQYGFLSNFHPAPIEIDGMRFPDVERYYVYMKSLDPEFRKSVLATEKPGQAKKIGSTIQVRPDWEIAKFEVMNRAVRAKFEQNPDLMAALKATAPATLLEDSPTDLVWGTGPIDEQGKFTGQNWLGKILMQVRDR